MGRPAEGWRLNWRNGLAYVRFSTRDPVTGKTVRPEIPTGERDASAAAKQAAKIYADAIAGRIQVTRSARTNAAPLLDLTAAWLVDLAKTYPANTVKCYLEYSRKWTDRWPTLGDIDAGAVVDYTRDGLGRALTKTIRKELSALLGNFFVWCVEKQHIAEDGIPPRPTKLLKKSLGKRTGTQRLHRVEATPRQVSAFIAAVPELGGHVGRPRWRARDAVTVMYETRLRPITVARLSVPEHWSPGSKVLEITDHIDKARFGRTLPLTKAAIAALERSAPAGGVIFGQHDYRTCFRKARLAAGTPAGFSLYDVRHNGLQHLVDAGAPLTGVAFLAGHKRLTTTNIYVRAAQGQAAVALGFGEIVVKRVSVKKAAKTKQPKTRSAKEGT